MYVAYVAVSAVVPSLLLMWYFHVRDTFPEPPRVVWTTFALGIAIVVPVVMMAWPFDQFAEALADPFLYGLAAAFLAAAIPEELFKLVVLWRYSARHLEFDEPMDGVVYGVAVSLGFATLENILYVSEGGLAVAALRALTAVPGHAFLGAIMGYYVGQARFAASGRRVFLAKAFIVPVVLHGLY
ncbi:MAG: PrsW family intramembrane metalloprotease, partial [bacterium]|nr:PrsW family intramembrane metalloprotease [bacterium]